MFPGDVCKFLLWYNLRQLVHKNSTGTFQALEVKIQNVSYEVTDSEIQCITNIAVKCAHEFMDTTCNSYYSTTDIK